jgi:hypothetical protein
VQASIPDSSGVAHGCYLTKGKLSTASPRPGDLRLIDTDAGKTCAVDEQPVDLATTGFVTTTVNATTFMIRANGVVPGPTNFKGNFDCGAGYISTDETWGATNNTDASNLQLQMFSHYNAGEVTTGTPNEFGEFYGHSSAASIDITIQGTCVDGRVFGLPGPFASIAHAKAQAKATLTVVN